MIGALPSPTVRVAGAEVPIATGARANIAADLADRGTAGGRLSMLLAWFGGGDVLPDAVARHAPEALEAAIAWSSAAMGCMRYGRPTLGAKRSPGGSGAVIDWEEDAAIICADFLRFYRIDLWEEDPHWYRFCALLLALVRTEGSLVGQAARARSPLPRGAGAGERERARKLADAWTLPPTDAELREMARARF